MCSLSACDGMPGSEIYFQNSPFPIFFPDWTPKQLGFSPRKRTQRFVESTKITLHKFQMKMKDE